LPQPRAGKGSLPVSAAGKKGGAVPRRAQGGKLLFLSRKPEGSDSNLLYGREKEKGERDLLDVFREEGASTRRIYQRSATLGEGIRRGGRKERGRATGSATGSRKKATRLSAGGETAAVPIFAKGKGGERWSITARDNGGKTGYAVKENIWRLLRCGEEKEITRSLFAPGAKGKKSNLGDKKTEAQRSRRVFSAEKKTFCFDMR